MTFGALRLHPILGITAGCYRLGNTLADCYGNATISHYSAAGRLAAMGLISQDILDRADLRRALAEHDFAAAFALIKQWAGLSQNRIAAACQLTPAMVSNIISGRRQITSYEVICRVADGLGIPGHLLGLARRPWEATGPDRSEEHLMSADQHIPCNPPWSPVDTVTLAAHLTHDDLLMDRRSVTRALAATVMTGPALLDPLEGWLLPAAPAQTDRRPGRLGMREVEQLEHTARLFRRWSHQYGGELRRKAVIGQLADVAAALGEHQSPAVEMRLYRVMAQLAGTAATMAWDSGLQRRAQHYYRLALRASHAGGDVPFGANVLAGMARQMLYCDRPQDALELVRLAQDGARQECGPRVRAMLHTREAWALAAMGRIAAFHRATERAREALADAEPSDDEPYWIAYFDEAELAGVTGGRLLDMARTDPRAHAEAAADSIRLALAARGPEAGRGHVLDRIGLAECHFLTGNLTEAVKEAHAAVDVAERIQSGRVRDQLAELYGYTVGHSASRPVREARDRIRALLTC